MMHILILFSHARKTIKNIKTVGTAANVLLLSLLQSPLHANLLDEPSLQLRQLRSELAASVLLLELGRHLLLDRFKPVRELLCGPR